MRILVLGLGNELLADDGVGILAARELRARLGARADVVESSLAGLALLDVLAGHDRAILIDAVQTGHHAPGTILELVPSDLAAVVAPSPHYAGVPELLALAARLEVDFPRDIRIFAVEVADPCTIGADLGPAARHALPELVRRVEAQVWLWRDELSTARAPAPRFEPQP